MNNQELVKEFTKNAEHFDSLMVKMLGKNEDLRICLANLLSLKEHKDKHGKDALYLKEQPLAWNRARELLK